jgi:predicted transport protein
LFAFGSVSTRANGRHSIKVAYDPEMQMSCVEVGDEVINIKLFLPTHKLSELLADAFEAQTKDPNAIGHTSWLEERVGGNKSLV